MMKSINANKIDLIRERQDYVREYSELIFVSVKRIEMIYAELGELLKEEVNSYTSCKKF